MWEDLLSEKNFSVHAQGFRFSEFGCRSIPFRLLWLSSESENSTPHSHPMLFFQDNSAEVFPNICNTRNYISSFSPDHCFLKAKKNLPPPPCCGSVTHAFPGQSAACMLVPSSQGCSGSQITATCLIGFLESRGGKIFCTMWQTLSYIWTWNHFLLPDHYRHRAFQEHKFCLHFVFFSWLSL